MAIREFPSAFPGGVPKTALERNVMAVEDLLKSIQGVKEAFGEIKKAKYESQLLSEYLKNVGKKPDENSQELTELLKAEELDLPAVMEHFGQTPQVPEIMKTRMTTKGAYKGPLTELEQAIIKEQTPEDFGKSVKTISALRKLLYEKPEKESGETEWRHTLDANKKLFYDTLKTGHYMNTTGEDTRIENQTQAWYIARGLGVAEEPGIKEFIQASGLPPEEAKAHWWTKEKHKTPVITPASPYRGTGMADEQNRELYVDKKGDLFCYMPQKDKFMPAYSITNKKARAVGEKEFYQVYKGPEGKLFILHPEKGFVEILLK